MENLHPVIADLLASAGQSRLRVASGSMRPLIQPGDILVCAPAVLKRLRCGDILIVRRAEDFLAHRLIRRRGEAWYTKGDRLRRLDAPVSEDQILARVVTIERGARRIDLTRWDQQIVQRMRGWWGAAEAAFFQAARFFLRR